LKALFSDKAGERAMNLEQETKVCISALPIIDYIKCMICVDAQEMFVDLKTNELLVSEHWG
jgi:hypothetical protein